ncbi:MULTISPECIES: NAD+ synthase [Gammaproteobacteria]|uniref:NAD+ synthase n=1 Tax=Gammaproteobacteria TaxID=1236 RepID=UPI000DCFE7C2|nr:MULTISPECIES: NAD+ synthase [Gammaproteobacteria]RTE85448.1 NAD+ synthase [Aliidiomarina sp. B3213]TCZ89415.1 NAD+ synthase [Lysobacter sp. N42]
MVSESLKIALAQVNFTVGALDKNFAILRDCVLYNTQADLIVFPELGLVGYPPEDLLFRPDLYAELTDLEEELLKLSHEVAILIGHPETDGNRYFNAVSFYQDGHKTVTYRKHNLPNYGVFDEKRYFTPGEQTVVVDFKEHRLGLLICEDLWTPEPVRAAKEAGADIIVSINASPYEEYKYPQRLQVLKARCQEVGLPLVYVNAVGGQDELIFDGNSMVLDSDGEACVTLPHCESAVETVEIKKRDVLTKSLVEQPDLYHAMYDALVMALRDYVEKNGFPSVLLGLSGGIDSALTLAIAVDALGGDRVHAVMMPYHYTASISVEDAKQQAEILGCGFDVVPIEPMVQTYLKQLEPLFGGKQTDTTEENLQARCRGVLLMALSNKHGSLLLTTGNKSELAVGYCTLYGDMCGGFAPIKDLPKSLVYALSNARNKLGSAIPERVITREPSAELAPDQKDQDSLPPYEVLDEIIDGYVERDLSVADLVASGYAKHEVEKVVKLIERSEYKRKQGAVGPKVTRRNFSKDRRMPITHGYLNTLLKR